MKTCLYSFIKKKVLQNPWYHDAHLPVASFTAKIPTVCCQTKLLLQSVILNHRIIES